MFLAFLFEYGGITLEFINTAKIILYIFIGITSCLIVLSEIVYIINNIKVFKDDVPHIEEIDKDEEQCINLND